MLNNLLNRVKKLFKKRSYFEKIRLLDRADYCMSTQMLFLQKDLSIQQLCVEIGTNRTYLSLAFKERGLNFYEYVNRYRVYYFYSLLNDLKNSRVVLIDLAEQSGFNSLRTLNRYVRREYGVTASQLRKQLYTKKLSIVLSDSARANTATRS